MILVHRLHGGHQVNHALVGLGHHHRQHAKRVSAAHHQQFKDAIKRGGVAVIGVDDGDQIGQRITKDLALHGGLACPKPVEVAPQRVELAVVLGR